MKCFTDHLKSQTSLHKLQVLFAIPAPLIRKVFGL